MAGVSMVDAAGLAVLVNAYESGRTRTPTRLPTPWPNGPVVVSTPGV
jgi:hypothetical protein